MRTLRSHAWHEWTVYGVVD